VADYGTPTGYQAPSDIKGRNVPGEADAVTRRKMLAAAMRGSPAPVAKRSGSVPSRHRELVHNGKTYDEIVTAAERGK
jgi:hypothetical protein